MKKSNFEELSKQILELVGGKENVSLLLHCVTRLRFNLKDKSLVKEEELKSLPGTYGTQWSGEQLQVIIGNEVVDLYHEICNLGGFEEQKGLEENLDDKKPLTVKGVCSNIIASIVACVEPVIVLFIVGGFFRLLVTLLGSATFGLFADDSNFIMLMQTMGNICFTYFPIFIAYSASKRFKTNPLLALLFACLLMSPDLTSLMGTEGGFRVFGIPVIQASYASTFLPALFMTWVLSRVEKFFKNLFPSYLKNVFAPFCTVMVMLPLTLCIIGPLGTVIGDAIANAVVWLQGILGPFAPALVGALFPLFIVTGMHYALISAALIQYAAVGFDTCILSSGYFLSYQLIGLTLATFIMSKKSEIKALATSCFLTIGISGISEPSLFGIMLKSKRALIYMLLSGFVGGFYLGVFDVKCYTFSPEGFPCFLAYSGGSTANLIHGIICCAIVFIIPFALGLLFGMGMDENEKPLLRKMKV